jgi:U3 small nucleolar ribonucleoprotein protein IMP4
MIVSHFPHGPTVYFTLHSVNLRHDLPSAHQSTVSEQYPHLIFENFSSKLGVRIRDVLKYLFPVPKEDSKRVMTFANESDYISFRCVALAMPCLAMRLIQDMGNRSSNINPSGRHHVFVKTGKKEVQLAEVGPRFEMKRKSTHSSLRISSYVFLFPF